MPGINSTNNLYNLTQVGNSNDLYQFTKAVNDLTGQLFMSGILIVGWVTLFLSMKRFGNREAFISSGFIISTITVLFSALDFVPRFLAIMIWIAFFIGATSFFLKPNQ